MHTLDVLTRIPTFSTRRFSSFFLFLWHLLSGEYKYQHLKNWTWGCRTQPEYSINPKVNSQNSSFRYFVFKILNQSFKVCNKYLTNKIWGLNPADSNAWHISSVELSPHKHFQKKKLPEAKISWHYEQHLKPQPLLLHLQERSSIDQVLLSAIQRTKLHPGYPDGLPLAEKKVHYKGHKRSYHYSSHMENGFITKQRSLYCLDYTFCSIQRMAWSVRQVCPWSNP